MNASSGSGEWPKRSGISFIKRRSWRKILQYRGGPVPVEPFTGFGTAAANKTRPRALWMTARGGHHVMAKLHPLLEPYQPSEADPFDAIKAAHLLNRAGFGGTPEEVRAVVEQGPVDAVDRLLDFPDAGAEEQSQSDVPDLSSVEGYPKTYRELQKIQRGMTADERMEYRQKLMQANRQAINATAAWWVQRMAHGPYPLQEKLTLFWHGHFTTSARDERSANLLWQQNELLRRQGAAN